jgi:hypothetical protein
MMSVVFPDSETHTMEPSPYIELKDKFGNSLFFGDVGGQLIPAFQGHPDFRQHGENIKNMHFNSSDVLIAGFPKTGRMKK